MDINPTQEVMKDLTNHLGWKWFEAWIKQKQDANKEFLLRAKTMEEVSKNQIEYDTYQTILSKVKSLCEKGK